MTIILTHGDWIYLFLEFSFQQWFITEGFSFRMYAVERVGCPWSRRRYFEVPISGNLVVHLRCVSVLLKILCVWWALWIIAIAFFSQSGLFWKHFCNLSRLIYNFGGSWNCSPEPVITIFAWSTYVIIREITTTRCFLGCYTFSQLVIHYHTINSTQITITTQKILQQYSFVFYLYEYIEEKDMYLTSQFI